MSYKTFYFDEIKKISERHCPITVKETNSGGLIFTEYGARLLGMFPSGNLPNTLWIAEDLDEKMACGNWLIGGERLWVAPERHYFYENPRDFDGFNVPAEIDPGEYDKIDDLIFENNFSLLNYKRNITYDESISRRTFSLIDDPYGSNLHYVGVQIEEYISITVPDLIICPWSLAQIYTSGPSAPGTALFPIRENGSFLSYFDPIPRHRASVEQGYARFCIDGHEVYKFALKPEDMAFDNFAKAIYVAPFPEGKDWFCLIKRSHDMPKSQEECVDPAKTNPSGPKGATQSYNSGPTPEQTESFPPFGEIELQLTKGTTEGNHTVSTAKHELLSYTGPKESIVALAQKVLGIPSAPTLYE